MRILDETEDDPARLNSNRKMPSQVNRVVLGHASQTRTFAIFRLIYEQEWTVILYTRLRVRRFDGENVSRKVGRGHVDWSPVFHL